MVESDELVADLIGRRHTLLTDALCVPRKLLELLLQELQHTNKSLGVKIGEVGQQ